MKKEEIDHISEINDRLIKIEFLFYPGSCFSLVNPNEGHFQLGKLIEYVKGIYQNTDEVE